MVGFWICAFGFICDSIVVEKGQTRRTSVAEVLAVSAGSHRGTTGEGGAMYLRLLISCICDFFCYIFVGSPVIYLRLLFLCIFNFTCSVFATL